MPNSLKVMIKKLAHKGCISSAERDELLMKLDGHDLEIRTDERAKTIDEVIALARAEIDFVSQAEQKRFVEFMKALKEPNDDK